MYEKKYEDYNEIDLSGIFDVQPILGINFFQVGEEIILSDTTFSVLLIEDSDNIYSKSYPEIVNWFQDFSKKYKIPLVDNLLLFLYHPKFDINFAKQTIRQLIERNRLESALGIFTSCGSLNFLKISYENY